MQATSLQTMPARALHDVESFVGANSRSQSPGPGNTRDAIVSFKKPYRTSLFVKIVDYREHITSTTNAMIA